MRQTINSKLSELPKNIKILIVIIIAIAVTLLLIFVNPFKKTEKIDSQKIEETLAKPLSTQEMLYPILNNNKILYLNPKNATFGLFDPTNKGNNQLIDYPLLNIQSVFYSFAGSKAIVNYKYYFDQSSTTNVLLDFDNKSYKNIDSNINNVVWSQTDGKIAYTYQKDNKLQLNISNFDGTNWQTLTEFIPQSSLFFNPICYINNSLYYLESSENTAITPRILYAIDIQTKKSTKVFDQSISQFAFSVDKKSMIYLATNKNIAELMIYNFDKQTNEKVGLTENIFDDNVIYSYNTYPSPDISYKNLPLLFNQNKMLAYFDDGNKSLIFYNIKTKKKTVKSIGEIKYAIIDESNKIMYFTNNGLLFKLDLQEFYD